MYQYKNNFLLLNERLSVLFTIIKILRTSILLKTSVFDSVVKLIKNCLINVIHLPI